LKKNQSITISSQCNQFQGFAQQWFLSGQPNGATPIAHVNLLPVWNDRIFGAGVVLCVIDDGVNFAHPDLASNYNAGLSYDYIQNDGDPSPVSRTTSNHGTPVASTCCGVNNRAVVNNGASVIANECGVGAAPQATLAAVRDLNVNSDSEVAQVVTHRLDDVDVYILTAGPSDDGRTAQAIGSMAQAAFLRGLSDGRNRLGAIYMYSAGNGGQLGDDCNFDGFASFRATVTVGAITALGEPTYYSEECAALHVVTPSTGQNNMISGGISGMFVAAYQGCFDRFGGTSGAAPLAAGVVALWLEAVPRLTWLDVQGLLAYSSSRKRTAVAQTSSWIANGAGLYFSHWFGFGVIDAQRGLQMARMWTSYPLSSLAAADSSTLTVNRNFSLGTYGTASWNCPAAAGKRVKAVEVYVTMRHARRGDVRIFLSSPFGTNSQLARARPRDGARDLNNWRFTCNAMWDESPAGMWQLRLEDTKLNAAGTLVSWRIVVHHTDPNNFSERGTRPLPVDDPPPAPTPKVIVISQTSVTPAPTLMDAVPVSLITASSDGWRFRLGPLHAAESTSYRFANVEYGERDGPNGDVWLDGAAPFGFGEEEERNGLKFATKFALNSTSAIFRKVVFLSMAQISVISRFRISCASDDYATVFFNGIPIFGETAPVRPRNYAYWNDDKEFGRVLVKPGPNMVAVQLFNGATSSDMVMDLMLEALVFAGSPFPAPSPVPTPAPTPFVPPMTRTMFVPVTDSVGDTVTGTDGVALTTVVVNTLPDFTEDTDGEAPTPESGEAANLFSLETGVPYMLFIVIGIALCLICTIVILGVVFVRSRRRRGGRRRMNRQRSRTRIAEYDRVLDQEMRKQTRAEPVKSRDDGGKPTDGGDHKKPSGGEGKAKPLPKAPSDSRPLPQLKASEEARNLPPLKQPNDILVSARDSPVQVRRKTFIAQPVNPSTPSAPPADDDDDVVVVSAAPKAAAVAAAAAVAVAPAAQNSPVIDRRKTVVTQPVNPAAAAPKAQNSPVIDRRKTVVTQPVNPATPANASPVGTPVVARREIAGGASQSKSVTPAGSPGQVRRAAAPTAAEPVKMLYVDLDQSATLRESTPPQYIAVDDFDDLPPAPRDLDNDPPPPFAEPAAAAVAPVTRPASQTSAPRPNSGLSGSRAHSATSATPVMRVASPLARATRAASPTPAEPAPLERPETPPPPAFSAEAAVAEAADEDESFDDEMPGLPEPPPFDENAM
jgi:subtilisin-like proprotein convertase family protein